VTNPHNEFSNKVSLDLKIVYGLVHVNCDDFFTFATVANTRGHDYKLYKPFRSSNLRKKNSSLIV